MYKEFLNESFGECLNCINSFFKSYCLLESKLVWGRNTILSEEGVNYFKSMKWFQE